MDSTVELRTGARRSVDVDVDLGGGRRLTGTVAGVYGTKLVSLGYSRLKAKQRLRTWVELLALSASDPDQSWTGHAVAASVPGRSAPSPGRSTSVPRVGCVAGRAARRGPEQAAAPADRHVGRVGRGARARPARRGRRREAGRPAGVGDRPVRRHRFLLKEDEDAYHVKVFGPRATVESLLDAGLPTYAWQVWEPLLSGVEKVGPL